MKIFNQRKAKICEKQAKHYLKFNYGLGNEIRILNTRVNMRDPLPAGVFQRNHFLNSKLWTVPNGPYDMVFFKKMISGAFNLGFDESIKLLLINQTMYDFNYF